MEPKREKSRREQGTAERTATEARSPVTVVEEAAARVERAVERPVAALDFARLGLGLGVERVERVEERISPSETNVFAE